MLVRQRYLGVAGEEVGGRRARRAGDRRINFDWDPRDDTLRGEEPAAREGVAGRRTGQSAGSRGETIIRTIDAFGNPVDKMIVGSSAGGTTAINTAGRFDDRNWREKELEEMQERDWRILKEDFGISTSGGYLPHPIRYWDEAPFPSRLADLIHEAGYDEPTPIQRQTIPVVLSGRDAIGIAETGSGKTAAFVLPMICRILKLPSLNADNMQDGPYGLVLAPTRELALQIEGEARKFCRPLGIKCTAIVGGHSMGEQSARIRQGMEIVIATPGRLRDCLEQHVLVLNQCFFLVLDEADRMIDMNFEEDLHFILSCLPASMAKPDSEAAEDPTRYLRDGHFRQITMFSATMPAAVEKLARHYLQRPASITVGQAGRAADTVEQRLEMLKETDKDKRLLRILEEGDFAPPIVIFVNQKRSVDFLSRRLEALGYRCLALHGGKSQEQRETAIAQIKQGRCDILIATDVAGRGIDIKDVSLVVNYDMAKSIEDYIHRIGRTGRMGKAGTAITFLTSDDSAVFFDLRALVQKAPKATIPPEFLSHEATRTRPGSVTQRRRHEERIFAYGV